MSVTAELADGRRLEFPDGTAPEVVQATVKRVLSGKGEIPGNEGGYSPQKKDERSGAKKLDDTLTGGLEAGLSMVTGATTGLLGRVGGTIGGIAGSVATGKFGTQEGAAGAGESAEEGARKLTFEPKTEAGKEALEAIGQFFDKTKLAGLGPIAATEGQASTSAARQARPAVRPAAGFAAKVVKQGAEEVRDTAAAGARKVFAKDIPDEALPSEMVGVGSAQTEQAAMRRARAESLPVPIKLSKGEAERTFEQQRFEHEAAKNPKTGGPLRAHYAENNEKILKNFDAWLDQTGAEAGSLRATGQAVTDAVVNKSNKAKTEIRSAYNAARESGDMRERIDVSPLQKYLDEHQPEAINAPVLTSAEAKLARVIDKDGTVSINDLEEVRKMVGRLSGKDATNATFGGEVKKVIDTLTEGKGGEQYKKARSLRFRYAQEFEDHAVVDRLLSFKPGTKDRAVAYEDVFGHTILKGSLDDVRAIRKTLQTAGKEGDQAWRELQGATIQHFKDEITKNVQIDHAGNRLISPARLDRLVNELDKDGKLDFIFGKQGAQQIRDVNGIAQDVFTSPPGSVNTSNTASVLTTLLDKVASKTTGVPFVGSGVGFISNEIRNARERKLVKKALE